MRQVGIPKILTTTLTFTCGEGPNGPYRHIQLVDFESGLTIARIEMTHQAFGEALAVSSGRVNCISELYEHENFGKTMEVKEEDVIVDFPEYNMEANKLRLEAAVKSHETNGWKADIYINHRRYNTTSKKYKTTFRRFVNID